MVVRMVMNRSTKSASERAWGFESLTIRFFIETLDKLRYVWYTYISYPRGAIGSAEDFYSLGCGFESCRGCCYKTVTQH